MTSPVAARALVARPAGALVASVAPGASGPARAGAPPTIARARAAAPATGALLAWARARARLAGGFALFVVALTLGRASIADQYLVPTGSMAPTITPGDHILVHKAAYAARLPFSDAVLFERDAPVPGDVVLFADPRGGPVPLVKRVAAVGGQVVAMRQGVLYVDGEPQRVEIRGDGRLVEHLGRVEHEAGSRDFEDFGPSVVPEGNLFMLGDNRAASLDSRFIGPVPLALVRGRVLGVVHPSSAAGLFSGLFREIE